MISIAGVNIPYNKRLIIALTYIYGIGLNQSQKILAKINFSENLKLKNLSEQQLQILRNELKNYKTEGELKREIASNIKRLIEIKTYRGLRHRRSMPVRGQNTHSNAKTAKKRRNIIINKKNKD